MEIISFKELNLLFPTSNKALPSVLKNASKEQLETLSEAKDLKTILTQLTNDTLDTTKSNKILLDVLKNSDFFKEIGSFPKEMKVLLELLQLQQTQDNPIKDILEKFHKLFKSSSVDIKDSDVQSLQNFVKNSGVFLESKFIQEYTPKDILKDALQELNALLLKSDKKEAPKLIKTIQALFENKTIFSKLDNQDSLSYTKVQLDSLLASLKGISKSSEPVHSKEVQKLIEKLEVNIKNTTKDLNFSVRSFKNILADISSELRISAKPSTKVLTAELENISSKIGNILDKENVLPLIKKLSIALNKLDVSSLTFSIDTNNLSKPISINKQNLEIIRQEVKTINMMKVEEIEILRPDDLKTFFSFIREQISPLNATSTKGILEILEKIFISLQQPSQEFIEEKVPKDIKKWLLSFDKELEKGDVVLSKSFQTQVSKLKHFYAPSHLLDNKLLQENLQKDLKALLLGLEKELNAQPLSNTSELLKSVDKLLLQVDYFQLLSHLSHSNYLYLPYTWDGLENGSFSFKSKKDGSCYCEIDLELKEYGNLNMMLQLFEDNQLNINVYAQDKKLQRLFKDNIKELKKALVSVNVMPRTIQILSASQHQKKLHDYTNEMVLDELGFQVKG